MHGQMDKARRTLLAPAWVDTRGGRGSARVGEGVEGDSGAWEGPQVADRGAGAGGGDGDGWKDAGRLVSWGLVMGRRFNRLAMSWPVVLLSLLN